MKIVNILCTILIIFDFSISQDICSYIGYINYGLIYPKGNYSNTLNYGKDIEATIIKTDDENFGLGLGIQYSELPYKSSDYNSSYRILFSKLYTILGSFNVNDKILYGAVIGVGMYFSFASGKKTSNYSYLYDSELESGYWLGLELGSFLGYSISRNFGLSFKVQYDILTKFIASSKYFSIKGGLMFFVF